MAEKNIRKKSRLWFDTFIYPHQIVADSGKASLIVLPNGCTVWYPNSLISHGNPYVSLRVGDKMDIYINHGKNEQKKISGLEFMKVRTCGNPLPDKDGAK